MTWFTPPAVLLLVTLCVSSGEDKGAEIVAVLYKQMTITAARGSSVKLSCEALYDFERCGLLQVVWHQNSMELTNPKRYLTTINETVSDDTMRRRQVVTEILHVTPNDADQFQCKAECGSEGAAMGHFIQIIVQD